MYVIFQKGNKQYQVSKGQNICLDKLNIIEGNILTFNKIIMFVNNNEIKFGNPFINNITVIAQIISHIRGKKIHVLKYKRRKHFRKSQGHRQHFTIVKIIDIDTK